MSADETYVLYGNVRSGNSYKPALMLALTGTPFAFVAVDLAGGEQKAEGYRAINPFAKVPALRHGDLVLRQSDVILRYLADVTGKLGGEDQEQRLRIDEWLFWEQSQIFQGVGRTRALTKFQKGDPAVVDFFRAIGEEALDQLEEQLADRDFLVGAAPTIADVAVYAYARLAEEGGFDMTPRPRIAAWRRAVEALPGWDEPANLMR